MIYLLDSGGRHIGPFKNREHVGLFIRMMALCGEDWANNRIVEGDGDDSSAQDLVRNRSCANPKRGACRLTLVGRKP